MLSPELNPRSYRPYISTSISAPSFPTISSSSHNRNPSPTSAFYGGATITSPSPSSSSSRSLKNSRFSPTSFAHNARLATVLLPCAAFLLDLGGTPVLATLTIGLMITYILDSINLHKSLSFFGVWFSLLSAQLAFFFSSPLSSTFASLPLSLLASFFCAHTTFLIGVWASLQFKWIQIEYPTIVLALERLLFACVPINASVLFTYATVSAVGMAQASYYFMAFSCVFYWIFSIPRVSSFKLKQEATYHGGDVPDDNLILTQLESCMHTLCLLYFP